MNTKKAPITRLYIVNDVASKKAIALVRATGVAQATRYIAEKTFEIKYADQADIIAAIKAGLEEESVPIETRDETEAETPKGRAPEDEAQETPWF